MAAVLTAAGGIARGDPGSVLAGLGGATQAIGGISALKGLPVIGDIGAVASALGGIFSLFGGSRPAVMIDGYSSRALTQQQQLLLALTGYKGVNVNVLSAGGDTARIAYQLGRDARTDGQSRVPPGWSG